MGSLHRLGPDVTGAEVDEVAVVLGLLLGPELDHGFDFFAHDDKAVPMGDTVILEFGLVPSPPDAEQEAPP